VRLGGIAGERHASPLHEVRLALRRRPSRPPKRVRVKAVRREGVDKGSPFGTHAAAKLARKGNEVVAVDVVIGLGVLGPLLLRGPTGKTKPAHGSLGQVSGTKRERGG